VTQERQTGTQCSHNKSRRPPGHPCRKRYWQKVERRDCPLAAGNVIHVAKSNCEDESSCCRGKLRSRRKFPTGFHNKATSPKGLESALRHSFQRTVHVFKRSRSSLKNAFRRARTHKGL